MLKEVKDMDNAINALYLEAPAEVADSIKEYWDKARTILLKWEVLLTENDRLTRKITQKEREKGRSENYWQLTSRQQWEEDKKLDLLDWDGE